MAANVAASAATVVGAVLLVPSCWRAALGAVRSVRRRGMRERLADAVRAGVVQGPWLRAQVRAGAFGAPAAPQRVSAMRLAVGTLPMLICFVAIVLRDAQELRFASEELRDGLAASLFLDRALVLLMLLAQLAVWAAVHVGGPDAVLIIARLVVWCYYIIPGAVAARNTVGCKPYMMCAADTRPMPCTTFLLNGLLGPVVLVMYLISGLPAHAAFGAEALRSGAVLGAGVWFAAAHPDGVSAAWLTGNVARCAVLACALPVLTAAVTGASDPLQVTHMQLCPAALRPLRDALVRVGEMLRAVTALKGVQRATLVGLLAYLLRHLATLMASARGVPRIGTLAAGWSFAAVAVAARELYLHRRRTERLLRSVERRKVHAMHLRLNRLDADPEALFQAAADELLAAFPHGCSIALAEFVRTQPSSASTPDDLRPRLRRVCARAVRDADAALLAAAVPAGVAPGGSVAAALSRLGTLAGLTLDAEDYSEGAARFKDWARMCTDAGRISVTLLGTGLDVVGAMWVHAPQGVSPPPPAVLCKFAEGVGAALLRCAATHARLAAAAAAARADADATLALQRAFISGVTHELRTPLNAVIGFSASILEESVALEPHLRDYLRCSLVAGTSLLAIVNQLLDYAKFEASKGEAPTVLTDEPLCLRSVLDALVDVTGGKAATSRVALCVEVDAALQAAPLRGDPARVLQILTNLVDNAIKFSPEGASVSVAAAACDPVTLPDDVAQCLPPRPPGAPVQQWARITVADTGRGVPPEHQWRLFRPFSQIARLPGEKPTGTGLGLVLCRSLARQMGGDITFGSQPGVGTTFTIVVPFDLTSRASIESRAALAAAAGEARAVASRSSVCTQDWLASVAVLTALPACGVGACIARMAATWGATAAEVAAPEGADASMLAQLLRAEAARATQHGGAGGAACRAVLLVVDAATLTALTGADAPPLPGCVACVLAAAPSERIAWEPDAAAARGDAAPATFLELPASLGRLQVRLGAALAAVSRQRASASAAAPATPLAQAAAAAAPSPYAALRILLAEDNMINARVATALLGRCGVKSILHVLDGAQAVEAAAAVAEPYSIILMDLQMPIMDGAEAARRIREHEAVTGRPRTWIVACTASSAAEHREGCLAAGMDVFIEKPLTPNAMRGLLQRHAIKLARGEA